MRTWRLVLLASICTSAPLAAQSEAALKEYFEGKSVTLRIAMPGTENGVDVYPADPRPLDYPRYADRLKDFGTSIRAGSTAMITKIRVKSKHVEFQLDGGGYGTMGDETSSDVPTGSTPKTKREQNLEAELKREKDPVRKRQMKEELDDLRRDREREDARNRAEVADAEAQKEATIRQRRLDGGSRFNIRYRDRLPDEALTPEGIKAALAEYVSFEGPPSPATFAQAAAAPVPPDPAPVRGPRKGMLMSEADAALGAPVRTSERQEGKLTVVTRTYTGPEGQVSAEFVEGVLIRYTMTSN
ncbi:MAG TPA: hypothetical protein VEB59_13690 [Gemmatimonadales bacterium]|nr:hypothetical protein [Gemmatimonadales bacterium]